MQTFYQSLLISATKGQLPSKILCVGKNYLKHAIEMGGKDVPKKPLLFFKPHSSILAPGSPIILPSSGNQIHHEVELGFILSKGGKYIKKQNWKEYIGGYFLALDLTDRTMQGIAKEKGFPWCTSKGQDTFLPMSNFIPIEQVTDPHALELELTINGDTRQKGNTKDMHFKIGDIIEHASKDFTLQAGDLFLTGTPEGVGKVDDNELVEATLRNESGELLGKISHIAMREKKGGESGKEESKE